MERNGMKTRRKLKTVTCGGNFMKYIILFLVSCLIFSIYTIQTENEGKNVFSMLKSFEYKVNKFLRDYGKDLDDDYEEMWKEKIVITKKAVDTFRRESEAMKEAEEREKLKERAETSACKEAEEKEKLEERAEVTKENN